MKRKFFRVLLRRRLLVILLLMMQIGLIIYFLLNSGKSSEWINRILTYLSIFVVLYVVNKRERGEYRLTWVMQILIYPFFGGVFYLIFKFQGSTERFKRRINRIGKENKHLYFLTSDHFEQACEKAPDYKPHIRYLQKFAGYPVYGNTKTVYLTPGEKKYEYLLEALKKAEKYIFLEYFIIREGTMWNTVLNILRAKADSGVDVRVIYDDIGCFLLLPKDYPKKLEGMGIKCQVFNPFRPFLSAMQNNRDHRKIVSIDGKIAFTGGVNLADEYINAYERFGHWKDAAIMIEGDAAWSLTLIFLEMWAICTRAAEDVSALYPWHGQECLVENDGLVLPYADSPMDNESVAANVYLQIINSAKEYVYINTPYLVIDDGLLNALCLAAKSGVDVRIVTPFKGDKWYVQMTSRSYYRQLIRAGVKIYEYSDGFIHSKTFVSDGKVATVGTTNLDFRSLYLHFECGVWMHGSAAVTEVYDDFVETLERCHQIAEKDCIGNPVFIFIQDTLRLFAPLM